MFAKERIDRILRKNDRVDECACRICLEVEQKLPDQLFWHDEVIVCSRCRPLFKEHKKTYNINGICIHVLYEYDEWIERLFFQYKEQRDVVLKDVFLYNERGFLKKKLQKYACIGLCSTEEKRGMRGFEPVIEIFGSIGIDVYSPFYRLGSEKQSSLSKEERKHILHSLKKKKYYPMERKKKPILVDDVLTTGNTVQAALALIECGEVFVCAAHPLWIQEHKQERVDHNFWK